MSKKCLRKIHKKLLHSQCIRDSVCNVLFFLNNVIVNIQHNSNRISHELCNFLNTDLWHFIAKLCAVIVPEDMSGQIIYQRECFRASGSSIHLTDNGSPHLIVGRFCDMRAGTAIKQICTIKGRNVLSHKNTGCMGQRNGSDTIISFRIVFDFRIIFIKDQNFIDRNSIAGLIKMKIKPGKRKSLPFAKPTVINESKESTFTVRKHTGRETIL